VDGVLLELRTVAPKAASICVLEAAAATREHNYPAAQRALATAVRLRPGDAELAELSRRATVLATQATPKSRPSPDMLDGWRLESRLGAGGWGQVFRASRDGQTRAIKVMHPEYAADAAFVARFKKEIAALLRLPRHPNLVGIDPETAFGSCFERRTLYLAMEYVDGPTLENYLAAKGPLTEGQVRKVFLDAIAGLAEAHRAGIVHRDIKPGNLIFRRQDKRLVFVDFGLAVGVEEMGQTKVGGISILFAAPEQHYGEPATQASDVFSLCAVIHYALNYDKPDHRKPNRCSPDLIPESLRNAVMQGMKSNADERFGDAGQLLAALSTRDAVVESPVPQTRTEIAHNILGARPRIRPGEPFGSPGLP
jgi:serine/threonine protein kinase